MRSERLVYMLRALKHLTFPRQSMRGCFFMPVNVKNKVLFHESEHPRPNRIRRMNVILASRNECYRPLKSNIHPMTYSPLITSSAYYVSQRSSVRRCVNVTRVSPPMHVNGKPSSISAAFKFSFLSGPPCCIVHPPVQTTFDGGAAGGWIRNYSPV